MIGDSKSDEDSAKKTKIKFIYSNKNFLKEIE
jgi:hypothetical protein